MISSPSAATDLYEECDNNANNKPNGPNLQAVQEYVPLGTAVALFDLTHLNKIPNCLRTTI